MDERMAEINDRIEQRLTSHKDEMLREIGKMVQISTATSANGLSKLPKLVTKELPKFKRKSNEEQYKVNHKVMQKLDEVQDSSDANECKALAKEASDMLGYRQKLILMADASELGWKVANEYETNPLSEDSDDERRIFKAEARAARKAKAERGKRVWGRLAPYTRGTRGAAGPARPQYPARPPVFQAKPGVCFACGKQGHWKNECPGNNEIIR